MPTKSKARVWTGTKRVRTGRARPRTETTLEETAAAVFADLFLHLTEYGRQVFVTELTEAALGDDRKAAEAAVDDVVNAWYRTLAARADRDYERNMAEREAAPAKTYTLDALRAKLKV